MAAVKPTRINPMILRQSSSSTSAISYKRSHPHKRHPALTSDYLHPAPPSAEEAVSNILYNTPPIGQTRTKQRHIFNCLVQNEPGVLSRVSGILAGRGFNIDSLVVAKTEVADLSRMTIVLRDESNMIEQARRQLEDLVSFFVFFFSCNCSIFCSRMDEDRQSSEDSLNPP
jgi:acetolactate synthase-1/3 small subunit